MSGAVQSWLDGFRSQGLLTVRRLPLAACPGWPWRDDAWRHDTGRYFSVVGVRATMGRHVILQPMIDQPEIGVLGFAVRCPEAPQWLLQAKTEPGNVQGTQVGPTVQATESNYQRVHGGRATPLIECFVGRRPEGVRLWSDSLQSEQGDRFLGKYNRNALAEVSEADASPPGAPWRWFAAAQVRQALWADYVVNTDARSVMVCSPWRWLTDDGGEPFARWHHEADGWGQALWHSSQQAVLPDFIGGMHAALEEGRRRWQVQRQLLPLRDLDGWRIDEDGIWPDGARSSHSIQAFEVQALDREVTHWAQPLVVGGRTARISLLCRRDAQGLRVLLRQAAEPGFRDGVQWGPSDVDDPAHHRLPWVDGLLSRGVERAAVHQSDEGGRFMTSVARYAVVELDPAEVPPEDPDAHWVTLAELQCLASTSGMLTNEARSVASLLLAWV